MRKTSSKTAAKALPAPAAEDKTITSEGPEDIRDAIAAIETFTAAMDFEAFQSDSRTVAAVERKLSVISEAAIRLGYDAEVVCPGLPWRDIRGLGNWLRHLYDRVDLETIWKTVERDLPPLRDSVDKALEGHGNA